ncbi:MAG TPA: hypothetical protein VM054_03250 [bacterium]|nr:hypothetical protein [bacterium]
MPVDELRINGDRVETILHLAKVLAFTRDRGVIENFRRSILLLEPLVDRSLLSGDEGRLFEESVRLARELCP